MRTTFAESYIAARRRRLIQDEINFNGAAAVDITQFCPSFADMPERAPYFDLVARVNPSVVTTNLVGVGVVDDGSGVTTILYPYTGEEETDCIRVRGIFPREGTGAAALIRTPFRDPTTANGFVNNRVFLISEDAQNNWDVQVGFEIPDLAWRGGRDGHWNNLAVEYESAPRARFAAGTTALTVSGGATPMVDLTAFVPHRGQIGDSPFVDLILAFPLADVTVGPRVGIVDVIGNADAAHAIYDKLQITIVGGIATVRVRKILPRFNAAATTLEDGTLLYVVNDDAANAYTCRRVFEVPSLDWV